MDVTSQQGRPQATAIGGGPATLRRHADALVAVGLAGAAALAYGLTSHGDWVFDALRYADHTQDGDLSSLLLLLHALANLVPLAAFELAGALGWDGGSLPVLEAATVLGAALAVAVVFLTARALGASLWAAVVAAALFAVALGTWRAGASAGVYGLTLLTLSLGWLAAVRYALAPSTRRAAVLGAAAGLALATHLASATFVLTAVALAVLVPPVAGWRARARTGAIAIAAAAALALPLLVLAAGLASDWSADGVRQWFLGPHVPEADPSRTVGFGLDGLVTTIASEVPPPGSARLAESAGGLALAATLALVLLAGAGAAAGMRAPGPARRAAIVLAAGAAAAVFAAGWYQAERPDYFALALIPLALLWALGADGLARLAGGRALAVALPLGLLALCLGAWNLEGEVGATADRARQREAVARTVAAEVPPTARVLLSPQLAPRAAYEGARAETGWAALLGQVDDEGAPRPGLRSYLEAEPGPVFASSRAFALTPAQAEYLGADEAELWNELRRCCGLRAVAELAGDAGPETLYRIEPGMGPAQGGGRP
jgi:hypothetical protein